MRIRRVSSGNPIKWHHLVFWKEKGWKELKEHLEMRHKLGYDICPSPPDELSFDRIFRPFTETPYSRVRIVILGQDPYRQKEHADGLAFSVSPKVTKLPGSLQNIFKEYTTDLGYKYPRTGSLTTWARNGVLLINSTWTVEVNAKKIENPRNRNIGHYRINGNYYWDALTTEVIELLSKRKDKLVFILWGKYARSYKRLIDETKHLVLEGAHPSPRNFTPTAKDAVRFQGGRYFTKAADYLNIPHSIWKLP